MKLRALKPMDYATRRLKAGDEFETLYDEHFEFLKTTGFAEDASEGQPRLLRRAKPASQKSAKQEKQSAVSEPLEEKTVPELREIADEKGVDLPSGYVRKDDLIEKLEEANFDQDEDTGRF